MVEVAPGADVGVVEEGRKVLATSVAALRAVPTLTLMLMPTHTPTLSTTASIHAVAAVAVAVVARRGASRVVARC